MVSEIDSLDDFISLSEDRGVLKKVIKEGHCDFCPAHGDTAFVHYVGTYHGGEQHGEKFDSSRDRNERFSFNVGKSEVIKAWDMAIPTMKLGEVCELIAFPDYAYMDGKTLRFEIELLEFYGADVTSEQDGTARHSVIEKGAEVFSPVAGAHVDVHIKGCFEGKVFDERDISYHNGDFDTAQIPKGVDRAIRFMSKGGKSIVRVSGHSALSDEGCIKHELPKGSKLEYEVTLNNFERLQKLTNFDNFADQMKELEKRKLQANAFLKEEKYLLAIDIYRKLSDEILYIVTDGMKEKEVMDKQKVALHLNIALAHLKLKEYTKCLDACDEVLQIDASNEKCLFRKGQAYLMRGDNEEALSYFKRVSISHPGNKAAAAQVKFCEISIAKAAEKEKKMYQAAFKRLGKNGFGDSETHE